MIAEALKVGSPIVRRTIRLGGAKTRHLGVTVSPIAATDGGLQAAVCLFTDLTAVVELEEQLRLKEALARLGELTAGLAHEFRNGLATIHGYGRLLDPATLPEQARTCVIGIREETTALGEVVTNFLRFARPEEMTMAPVELRSVLTSAMRDVPGASDAVTLEGNFATINGDEVLLRRAFNNLFRNSLEACQEIGMPARVSVREHHHQRRYAARLRRQRPRLRARLSGENLSAVCDDESERHGARTRDRAESDRVAQRPHHCRQSTEGGAQFRVRLPIAPSS